MENPGTAAVLSFLISGMGQIYHGQIAKGVGFVALQLVNLTLMTVLIGYVTFFLLWVYAIYDAHKQAEKINVRSVR
jgi:TM2 domain-containing membrane protein YozV